MEPALAVASPGIVGAVLSWVLDPIAVLIPAVAPLPATCAGSGLEAFVDGFSVIAIPVTTIAEQINSELFNVVLIVPHGLSTEPVSASKWKASAVEYKGTQNVRPRAANRFRCIFRFFSESRGAFFERLYRREIQGIVRRVS